MAISKLKATRQRASPLQQRRKARPIETMIVVSIDGGIADVTHHTGVPCRVVIRDYDTDGVDDEGVSTDSEGRRYVEQEWLLP